MNTQEVQSLLDQCRGIVPHPCQGCKGFNNAVKCAAVPEDDCTKFLVSGK